MSANGFGELFHITSFGESHGKALGVIIEGCPAGVLWDEKLLKRQLERRRPGTHPWLSARKEEDEPLVLSGVYKNKTLGTPISLVVFNKDARSQDYKNLKPRRGHADLVLKKKYIHTDLRGGGRSSGRETLSRVMAGSVAEMFLKQVYENTKVSSRILQVGPLKDFQTDELASFLKEAKEKGESYGGVCELLIQDPPSCLGQPVFKKLKSDLASSMMSVGASSAFEIGSGFEGVFKKGTQFHTTEDLDPYGGIQGGLSTGKDIRLRLSFKPTSSVLEVAKKGRHDPCIIPRAMVVLECMAWLVLADHFLWSRLDNV